MANDIIKQAIANAVQRAQAMRGPVGRANTDVVTRDNSHPVDPTLHGVRRFQTESPRSARDIDGNYLGPSYDSKGYPLIARSPLYNGSPTHVAPRFNEQAGPIFYNLTHAPAEMGKRHGLVPSEYLPDEYIDWYPGYDENYITRPDWLKGMGEYTKDMFSRGVGSKRGGDKVTERPYTNDWFASGADSLRRADAKLKENEKRGLA